MSAARAAGEAEDCDVGVVMRRVPSICEELTVPGSSPGWIGVPGTFLPCISSSVIRHRLPSGSTTRDVCEGSPFPPSRSSSTGRPLRHIQTSNLNHHHITSNTHSLASSSIKHAVQAGHTRREGGHGRRLGGTPPMDQDLPSQQRSNHRLHSAPADPLPGVRL